MATNHIDINTATVEDFEKLFGVGRSKAEAVVRHRKVITHSMFISYIHLGRLEQTMIRCRLFKTNDIVS